MIAFSILLLFAGPNSRIEGTVSDTTGATISDVQVVLLKSGHSAAISTRTSVDGSFRFDSIHPGSYLLDFSKGAFSSKRVAVVVVEGKTLEMPVALDLQPVASEITVTAEVGNVASLDDISQPVNVVSRADIEQRFSNVLADVLREEVGVDVQRTSPVMGGVSVRGLLGKNVAVYRDGVRYTTSAQRGGVSTFFNLNDAANIDSVEILRGPDSAQYSSDSIGGTVHLLSRVTVPGASVGWSGEFAGDYNTAAHGFGGNLLTSYGGEKLGLLANVTVHRASTLRPGAGLESHAAITRFLGLPSSLLGERLTDTAFTQYGGMLHTQRKISARSQLIFHYERSQQDGGKRWDQLLGGDGNLIADVRNVMLDFGYLRYADHRAAVTLSFNKQREERANQGGNGNPQGSITHQYERTQVFGTNFYFSQRMGSHQMLVGGDGYRETAASPAYTLSPSSGAVTFSRPRIPDGARYLLYGLYLQDAWEILKNGRLRLNGALRYGGASYQSPGTPVWPEDNAGDKNFSGRIGIVVRPAEPLRVHFNYSRGFRAPSMTDLGTLGIQGNGFFEASFADLGSQDATIGDRADDRAVSTGRAVARVRSETSNNYDLGFRVATSRLRTELNAFQMDLRDTIVSQTLIMPPGAVGRFLGDQQITRQLASGAVFVPAATAPVQIRGNLGGAQLHGIEQLAEIKVFRSISLVENLTWIYAKDVQTALPPDIEGGTPPLTSNVRLRWTSSVRRYWGEIYSTLADRQERLSSLALADRRTGATRSRANIASFFNNGARVRGLVSNGILLATGENLAAVQNRVLGIRDSAPLFTAIPGYALFGIRGGFNIGERSNVLLDFSNLLDKSHRGVSWGVDGAGRSIAVKYGYQF